MLMILFYGKLIRRACFGKESSFCLPDSLNLYTYLSVSAYFCDIYFSSEDMLEGKYGNP